MVIEGAARGRPAELAAHLLRTDHNESVHVLDMWGIGAPDLLTALKEMHAIGAGAKSTRTLYHANIDPRENERLTAEQKRIAVIRLGTELGLMGQPFVVVAHVKKGREHLHVVWSRIDLETMTAIPDSHNFRKHEEVARGLEIEFGHQQLVRVLTRDKATEPRPEQAPRYAEYQQLERSGMTPQEAKKIVTECWNQTTTGSDFQHRLAAEGFTVARGDRRDFVLIDRAGEVHGLTRRIEFVKAAEVRYRMKDLDGADIPDIAEARALIKQRQKGIDQEAAKGFTSAADRLRAEELERQAQANGRSRPHLSGTDQDIADALWQLDKTMRGQMAETVVSKPTIPEQQQHRAEIGARPEMEAERVRYQSGGRTEATGGGGQREQQRPEPVAMPEPIQPPPAPTRTAESAQIERPQPSLWQRVKDWVRGPSQDRQQGRERDLPGADLPGTMPEAPQRPSYEVEKQPATEQRPSAHLFVRIFGALIDAYQHAIDRAIAEHQKAQQATRAETLKQEAQLRRDVEQVERDKAGAQAKPAQNVSRETESTRPAETMPAAASKVQPAKVSPEIPQQRSRTAEQKAADRLRDDEERRQRENTLDGKDPRY